MLEKQIQFEELFNKNQEWRTLIEQFSDKQTIAELEEADIPISFGIKALIKVYQHKQVSPEILIAELIDSKYEAQTCADLLTKMFESNLIGFNENWNRFVTLFDIDDEIKTNMEKWQFPLPLIIEPMKVKNNHSNGYHKFNNESLLLNNSYHKEDICLDHINRVNKIPLSINLDVAYNIKNKWKNLDKKNIKETLKEYRTRVNNFERYMRVAYMNMELIAQEGNKCYLTHAYDKRGRTYSRGYHILDQGNDWNKACVEFHHKEFIE